MAATIKAINAKIRSNKVADYFCSTRTLVSVAQARGKSSLRNLPITGSLPHLTRFLGLNLLAFTDNRRPNYTDFWGPASNFGIPLAAVMDTQKDPEMYGMDRNTLFGANPSPCLVTHPLTHTMCTSDLSSLHSHAPHLFAHLRTCDFTDILIVYLDHLQQPFYSIPVPSCATPWR